MAFYIVALKTELVWQSDAILPLAAYYRSSDPLLKDITIAWR